MPGWESEKGPFRWDRVLSVPFWLFHLPAFCCLAGGLNAAAPAGAHGGDHENGSCKQPGLLRNMGPSYQPRLPTLDLFSFVFGFSLCGTKYVLICLSHC